MPVVEFVGVIGSFASMIGLSLQVFDRAKKGSGGKDDLRVGLYVALTDVTKTWKLIHNQYHVLSPEIRKLTRKLSDPKGGLREARDVSDGELRNFFNDAPLLAQQSRIFKIKLEVYFKTPRLAAKLDWTEINAALGKISSALDISTSQAAENIYRAQCSAIQAHDEVCEFFDKLAPLLRKSSWNSAEKEVVLKGFFNLEKDFDTVIMESDMVLLNVIDLYEYVSRDLLEAL